MTDRIERKNAYPVMDELRNVVRDMVGPRVLGSYQTATLVAAAAPTPINFTTLLGASFADLPQETVDLYITNRSATDTMYLVSGLAATDGLPIGPGETFIFQQAKKAADTHYLYSKTGASGDIDCIVNVIYNDDTAV